MAVDYGILVAEADRRRAAREQAKQQKEAERNNNPLIRNSKTLQEARAARGKKDYGDQEYIEAGEDPRVTELYRKLSDLSSGDSSAKSDNRLVQSFRSRNRITSQSEEARKAQKAEEKAKTERQRQQIIDQFLKDNPDLNPTVGEEVIEVEDMPKGLSPAEQDAFRKQFQKKTTSVNEFVQGYLRVVLSPDASPDDVVKARAAYDRHRGSISDDVRKKYALDQVEEALASYDKALKDSQPGGVSGWMARNVSLPAPIAKGLELSGVPFRSVLAGIANAEQLISGDGPGGRAGAARRAVLDNPVSPTTWARIGSVEESTGRAGDDGQIENLREALGLDPRGWGTSNPVGRFAGNLAEGAFSVVGDPTNYVTFGRGTLGRAGLAALEDAGQAGLANAIRQGGMGALSEAQQAVVRKTLQDTVESQIRTGATRKSVKVAAQGDEAVIAAAEKKATRIAEQLQRRGRGGLAVGGYSTRNITDPARNAAGIPRRNGARWAFRDITTTKTTSRLLPSELGVGDTIEQFGGSEVLDVDSVGRTVTIQPPKNGVVVYDPKRPGEPQVLRPSEITPGMHFTDNGNWDVMEVLPDGEVVLKPRSKTVWTTPEFSVEPPALAAAADPYAAVRGQKVPPELVDRAKRAQAAARDRGGVVLETQQTVSQRSWPSDTVSVFNEKTGNWKTRRLWRQSTASGKHPIPVGQKIYNAAEEPLGTVKGWTDNAADLPQGASALILGDVVQKGLKVGDSIDLGTGRGIVTSVSGRGKNRQLTIVPDQTDRAARTFDQSVATDVVRRKVAAPSEAGTVRADAGPSEPLALPAGRKNLETGEIQPSMLREGDTLPKLGATVVGRDGNNIIVRMDDGVPPSADLGVVVRTEPDGSLVIKPPSTGIRTNTVVDYGGAQLTEASWAARNAPTLEGVTPRAKILQAERQGVLESGTARRIRNIESRVTGVVTRQADEMVSQIRGAIDRLDKALTGSRLGRRRSETLSKLNDLLDAPFSDLSPFAAWQRLKNDKDLLSAAEIRSLTEAAKPASAVFDGLEGAALEEAVSAMRIIDDINTRTGGAVSDKTLFEQVGSQRLPLIVTKKGQKILNANPVLRDALGVDPSRRIAQNPGFDWGVGLSSKPISFTVDPEHAKLLRRVKSDMIDPVHDRVVFQTNGTVADIERQAAELVGTLVQKELRLKPGETIFENNAAAALMMRGHREFVTTSKQLTAQFVADDGLGSLIPSLASAGTDAARVARDKAIDEARRKGWVPAKEFSSEGAELWTSPIIADHLSQFSKSMADDDVVRKFGKAVNAYSNFMARYQTSSLLKGLGFSSRNTYGNLWAMAVENPASLTKIPDAFQVQRAMSKVAKMVEREGISWEQAINRSNLKPWIKNAIGKIDEHAVTRSGFFAAQTWDAARRETADMSRNLGGRIAAAANPFGVEFAGTKYGGLYNQFLEDNARIALFLASAEKYGSFTRAREAVARTLFDYDDLTPFEKTTIKGAHRFYTYMRKNFALQAYTFGTKPGLMVNAYEAQKKALGAGIEDASGLFFPNESEGTQGAGDWANSLIGGGASGVIRMETPVDAFMSALNPAFIGLEVAATRDPKKVRELAASLATTFTSSGQAQLGATIIELGVGKDLFFQRDIKDEDTWDAVWDVVAPFYSQGRGLYRLAADQKTVSGARGADRAEFARLILGINYSARDSDRMQNALLRAQIELLDETITKMKASGDRVPTISEMRDAGILPALETPKKGRTVEAAMSPEQRQAVAREKIYGVRTGE